MYLDVLLMSELLVNISSLVYLGHTDAAVPHLLFQLQFLLLPGFHGDPFPFSMNSIGSKYMVVMETKQHVH